MRYLAVVFLVLASCASPSPASTPAQEDPPLIVMAGKPSWVGVEAFAISSTVTAAVGVETIDVTNPCWSSDVLLAAVKNRALASLAKVFNAAAPGSEAAIAELEGAEVNRAWYDGRRTLYALATIKRSSNLPVRPVSGGMSFAQLGAVIQDVARSHLEQTGICNDPHKRLDAQCCGGPSTFCSDPTRYDTKFPGGKCACVEGPPCHHDYVCEQRQGQKKCICRGRSCPCEVRECSIGETCGDGRCY